jgi:hypothetical protein
MRWDLSDSLSCVRVVGSNVVCGVYVRVRYCVWVYGRYDGDVAQMVERSLSMREVLGSIPSFSKMVLLL